jgi:hypothetical protein
LHGGCGDSSWFTGLCSSSAEECRGRRLIVEVTMEAGASVVRVALKHGVNANQAFKWKRLHEAGSLVTWLKQSLRLIPVQVAKTPKPRRRSQVLARFISSFPDGSVSGSKGTWTLSSRTTEIEHLGLLVEKNFSVCSSARIARRCSEDRAAGTAARRVAGRECDQGTDSRLSCQEIHPCQAVSLSASWRKHTTPASGQFRPRMSVMILRRSMNLRRPT